MCNVQALPHLFYFFPAESFAAPSPLYPVNIIISMSIISISIKMKKKSVTNPSQLYKRWI